MGLLVFAALCLAAVSHASAELNTMSAELMYQSREHHTDKFKLAMRELIVRRGGNISLTLGGKGKLAAIQAEVWLNDEREDKFVIGSKRPVADSLATWSSSIDYLHFHEKKNETSMNVTFIVPVRAMIGKYKFVLTEEGEADRPFTLEAYVLFNPWNKGNHSHESKSDLIAVFHFETEDTTYMVSRSERDEYVLNDMGKVYVGSINWFDGKEWVFGQFHENVLPAVMLLLSRIPDVQANKSLLADPVLLSRAISAGVNANDDFGVIVGNWGSNFYDGTSPMDWASSVAILEEYLQNDGEPVRYGQCWVFAAVTTTVLRALGVPARPITTFRSAHDTDDSLTVDVFYDESMNEIEGEYGSDSIWNFHAWTEAWMSRPDVTGRPAGGWQVVDATPQEVSNGLYQTGPASVAEIRDGNIDHPFDMHFVFSEVQSQEVRWQVAPAEPMGWKRLSADINSVAPKILTKRIGPLIERAGTSDAEDVTFLYKHQDLNERRVALMNAAKKAGVEPLIVDLIPADAVVFSFSPMNRTEIGEPITGFVEILNTLEQPVKVNSKIRIDATYYNGIRMSRIAAVAESQQLEAGHKAIVPFEVPFEDYYTKLLEHCLITISASAIVSETDQVWVKDIDFQLKTPGLNISLNGDAVDGLVTIFDVTFRNPLPISLTECQLLVHGTRPYMELAISDIAAGETIKYQVDVMMDHVPLVIVDMDCAEVLDMTGSTIVTFKQ